MSDPKIISNLVIPGLGPSLSSRVLEIWGSDAFKKIEENPYSLIDIEGIGFSRADKVAKQYNVREDDPRRSAAIIKHSFQTATSFGHTFLSKSLLKKEVKRITDKVLSANLETFLKSLVETGDVVQDGDDVFYLKQMYHQECSVAEEIKERLKILRPPLYTQETLQKLTVPLDSYQLRAINEVFSTPNNITILTGGPGTGKTHTTKIICDLIEAKGGHFALCAPTGKAAKRLMDLTNRNAYTIHRLLRASYTKWGFNKHNPLTGYDFIIVDESSMLDLNLAYRLFSAIPVTTRIIFIGDVDQLSPVGPGNFYKDIIRSKKIPTFRLCKNHRQGLGSMIAENALRINSGVLNLTFNNEDIAFVEAPNPIELRSMILPLIAQLLKKYTQDDIQVLSPQHSTNVGVTEINKLIRMKLNDRAYPGRFTVGDRVMQTVNDYSLGVFNGYVGRIMMETADKFIINFFDYEGESAIAYPKDSVSNLIHAYCCTVHKFQGSEFKAGIIILSTSHTWMLTRNLFYTALTRARERVIILGDKMALKKAITNTREAERNTRLLERLNK